MKKILIAEDDRIVRKTLVKGIEKMGHTALQASNGRRAFHILQDNPDIDLLVADVQMPEMGGRALIQILRGDSRYAHFPIIIISAIVSISDIKDLLDLGASRFLAKPISIKNLQSEIKSALD